MSMPTTPDMSATGDGESRRVTRTTPLPVEVVERPGDITLTLGGEKVAVAWGPAVDDPNVWFWWNGRMDPYRIGGALYDEPALDGRVAALGLIDDERRKWERHEASLWHPDHGPLVDEWWMAVGPSGTFCWGCGDSVTDDRRVATVVLGTVGVTSRHYVCANCEIWFDDDEDDEPMAGD